MADDHEKLWATNRGRRTLSNLSIDIEAAEAGRLNLLLPESYRTRKSAAIYPLPWALGDLARLAALPAKPASYQIVYIKRARAAYQKKLNSKTADTITERAADATQELNRIKDLHKQAADELNSVRIEAEKARASLTDLYGLVRQGMGKILGAFVDGKKIAGEPVDPLTFISAAKGILSHVDRLGGPITEDSKQEAEEVIFEQVVTAQRERVEKSVAVAVDVPDTEH